MTQIMFKNRRWLANTLLSTCLTLSLTVIAPLARGADPAPSALLHLTLLGQSTVPAKVKSARLVDCLIANGDSP